MPQFAIITGFLGETKDYAAEVGAPHVTCCPLGDGYEFPFNADYTQMWKRLCDTFGEAAGYRTDRLMHQPDYIKTWRFIEENLLPLG